MLILTFGVSTIILNPVDISCRWYKLNFGLLQGQVKLYHLFPICFNFLYKFLEIIDWKRHWTIILDTDLDSLLLLNGTGWDWHLNNSFWIQNIPNLATNNINIWFLSHNTLSDQEKLGLIVLIIAEQIIRESHHSFLKLSPFFFQRRNI